MAGAHRRVLVLGGGDGLVLREVLKYDDVDEVRLVDLDPAVTDLARTFEPISSLNRHSFDDPRVARTSADAFPWVRDNNDSERFDATIVHFPDPDSTAPATPDSQRLSAPPRPHPP